MEKYCCYDMEEAILIGAVVKKNNVLSILIKNSDKSKKESEIELTYCFFCGEGV